MNWLTGRGGWLTRERERERERETQKPCNDLKFSFDDT